MKEIIGRIPLPMSGLALGLASLSNLMDNDILYHLFGAISGLLLVLLAMKMVLFPEKFKEDFKSPILASVFCTFPMAMMVLSTHATEHFPLFAKGAWFFAIAMHVILMVFFTMRFMTKLDMTKVFASYFIVYVGIVVASVTCPFFDMFDLGKVIFWFGFIALIPLFVLITYRYIKFRDFPEPTFPLLCIYSAPVSLCIVGYVKSMTQISEPFVLAMYALSVILYLFGLFVVLKTLTLRFYPSYAALTFPMVICATATKVVSSIAEYQFLEILALVETVIATTIVLYVLIRYTMAIARPVNG